MTNRPMHLALVAAVLAALLASPAARACDDLETLALRRSELAARTLEPAERAAEHYSLGVWARDRGLEGEARKEFESVTGLVPDHEGARSALGHVKRAGAWLTPAEAMREKGLVLHDGAWRLPEEVHLLTLPKQEREKRLEAHRKVQDLLGTLASGNDRARDYARKALDTVADEYKADPMAYALRAKSKDVRLLAAVELGRLKDRRTLRPLLHRAILDPDQDVRFAAIDAAKAFGDANLLAPFVTALGSEKTEVVTNAAAGIAHLGDVRGVQYLVYRYEVSGGGAPRVYFSQISQLTYIQDFDVEVAQTAFIADPIVGVMQEGTVLDVQVVAINGGGIFVEREAIHGALRRLTGATDVKNEPGAWAAWYEAHRTELAANDPAER